MRYTSAQYASALHELLEETPERGRRFLIRNFLAALATHGALGRLSEIFREYEAQRLREQGIVEAAVRAPNLPSGPELARKFPFAARVAARRDPSILGGIVIEVGDARVDNSIAARLMRMRQALAA